MLSQGNIGTGILAMPDAIKNSGLLVGNLGLVLMACICIHCMHLLGNHVEMVLAQLIDTTFSVQFPRVVSEDQTPLPFLFRRGGDELCHVPEPETEASFRDGQAGH